MTAPAPTPGPGVRGSHAPEVVHVIADSPEALQDGLDTAVLQLREAPGNGQPQGILITRWSRSLFTVETSSDVPFGTTIEKDRWRRHAPTATRAGDMSGQ